MLRTLAIDIGLAIAFIVLPTLLIGYQTEIYSTLRFLLGPHQLLELAICVVFVGAFIWVWRGRYR